MALSPTIRSRLEIQGFVSMTDTALAEVEPWLRFTPSLCGALMALGTALASTTLLLLLVPIAALGAALPFHPFDLIYNYGVRRLTRTGPLPHNGAPRRFACGVGAVWLLATAWAFSSGAMTAGYVLGAVLTAVAALVSASHICIPSLVYCAVFGHPARRRR